MKSVKPRDSKHGWVSKKVYALLIAVLLVCQLTGVAYAAEPEEPDVSQAPVSSEPSTPEEGPASDLPPDGSTPLPQDTSVQQAAGAPMLQNGMGILSTLTFDDMISDAVLSLTQGGAQISDGTVLPLAQAMSLSYTFSASVAQCQEIFAGIDAATITNGTAYSVPFPVGLKWVDTVTEGEKLGDLNIIVDEGGGSTFTRKFGEFYVNKAGKSGTVYFGGPFWERYWTGQDPDQLPIGNGYLYMGCQMDESAVGTGESLAISLTPTAKTVTLKVAENQKADAQLTKTAGGYDATTGRFSWTIKYTPGNKEPLAAHWLHDVYNTGSHEFVPGSMVINGGSLAANTPLVPTVVRDTPATGQAALQVELTGLVAKTVYTITYQTALSDAALSPTASAGKLQGTGTTTVENQAFIRESAAASEDKVSSAKVSASATPAQKQWMVKTGAQDSTNGRLINWTIVVNTMDRKLRNLTVYDNFNASQHALVSGSVKVNGSTSGFTLGIVPGTFTQTTPMAVSRPYQFKISLPDVTTPTTYTITYQTLVDDSYYASCEGDLTMNNDAWLDFIWESYGPGTGTPPAYIWPTIDKPTSIHTNVLKKSGSYNVATHTITWLLTLNPYNVEVGAAQIIDDFANEGYTYVPNSFKTANSTGASIADSARVTLDGSSTTKKLVLNVAAAGTTAEQKVCEYFTFQTTVDDPLDFAYNSAAKKYYNTATFRGVFAGASGFEKSVTADVSVASEVVKKQSGAYSYADNTLTWSVTVNANKMPMPDAKLRDTMSVGQSYFPGSITLVGAGQTTLADSYVDVQGQDLTIDLGALADGKTITVTYKTKLNADTASGFKDSTSVTVTNRVQLLRDSYPSATKTASTASKAVTNNVLTKTGQLNRAQGYIEYTVPINPNNLDLTGLRLKDTLPASLALDGNTLALYNATVSADGTFTKNGGSLGGAGFLNLEMDTASNSFTIGLPTGRGRYILVYRCDVLEDAVTYSNKIEFLGGVTGNAGAAQGAVNAGAGGGGASASLNRKFRLNLTAQDELRPERKLSGVTYGIYTVIDGVEVCVYECKTGSDGTASVYPLNLNQAYTIRQLSNVPGYPSTMVEEGSGTTPLDAFTVQSATKAPVAVTLLSAPVSPQVTFNVINDWNRPLGSVGFRITDLAPGSSFAPVDVTSTSAGFVDFGNVPVGTYRLKQLTTSIQYHDTNTVDYVLEVKPDGSYSIYRASDSSPIQNGNYINVVKKADVTVQVYQEEDHTPLANSHFRVLDKDGKVVGEAVAGADGLLTFKSLALGEGYTIVEVEVPGYNSSPNLSISLTGANESGMTINWPKNDAQFIDLDDSSSPAEQRLGSAQNATPASTMSPQTGDGAHPILWICLLAVSITGLVVVTLKRKAV